MINIKYFFLFTLVCLTNLVANAGNNSNNLDQPITKPSQHNQPLSQKVPQTKLGTKADKMNLGSCEYLDYYIYYCKTFTCSLNMPVPGNYKLTFNVKEKTANNICNINYNIDVVSKQGDKIPFKIKCQLDKDGVESLRYQWKYYSNGYVDVFTRRSDDPVLKKQCKASIEM